MTSYKCITINGKQERLHRLIMEAYIGRKLQSWELVHHIDGDKHNNELSNLSITTRANHMATHNIGIKTRYQRTHHLTRHQLYELYVEDGLTIQSIADKLHIGYGCVYAQMKEHRIRESMVCVICNAPVTQYVRARLCHRCYHRKYQRAYRAKSKAI